MSQFITDNSVLIIEDEPMQRKMVKKQLEERSFRVLEADSGEQGLAIWRDNPNIRLIITDLNMPGIDGFEVIETIRSEENHYTYLIVLSGISDQQSLVQALQIGADDYLTKPVSAAELDLRVKHASRLLRLDGMEELVFCLTEIAGYRSDETGQHLQRVQAHCRIMAGHIQQECPELNLSKSMVKDIATASLLHDIGKAAVPGEILHKPGPLSRAEFEQIKPHTSVGGQLLWNLYKRNNTNFFKLAYEIAIGHHEKWDGSGYPNGLSGTDIPLASRIMAVVDVYDALTAQRCYKERLTSAQATEIITHEAGQHFDPLIVDAFLKTESEWLRLRNNFQDSDPDYPASPDQ